MRILIAEDDPKLLKSLVHIFEMNNYAVDGVGNGNDAFDFASSDEYDGLVLDIMMPGMDGVTLLKKLRANGITTPALFLTAKTETYQKIKHKTVIFIRGRKIKGIISVIHAIHGIVVHFKYMHKAFE